MAATVPTTRPWGEGSRRAGSAGSRRGGRAVVLDERTKVGVVARWSTSCLISSRIARHRSTGPSRSRRSTVFTARSNATHAMTFEWVKCRLGPRTSQMPSSSCRQPDSSQSNVCARVPRRRPTHRRPYARLVQGVDHLAVDVELELARCPVADPHGLRALVAREPRKLDLDQAPLTRDPVHDLDVLRRPGDRAEQPIAPRVCLVQPSPQERQQGQRRVAEPAVAVVPVPHAADRFR